ncbi:MAG TPA: alpha/beta hydrolase domain-containing protein [Sphingomonadaceae bacterium]|nr:alpha/beta hydrolase domain-containing protein [Sphingomonadaceae bacterium]
MSKFVRLGALLCVSLATLSPAAARTGAAEARVAPFRVPVPRFSNPVPVTPESWPWIAADRTSEPVDLAAHGYVEEEYLISGTANVYNWPAVGRLTSFARGPYTTRIVVRRPRDPAKFSGTAIVEPLNPSLRYDLPIMWGESYAYFMRHGDVWVGVTVKPVAIQTLKEFDAKRYASLGFPNPLPPARTCSQSQLPMPRGGLPVESSPATENGLIWDVLSQVGALMKEGGAAGPLHGLPVSRLYMTGDSQSGAFVLTYANAIHKFARDAHNKPLYDGYLAAVATGPGTPIHQCASSIPAKDPRWTIQPIGVPVIIMVSESEITSLRRRPDGDAFPDLFRSYEVAGASHVHEGGEAGEPAHSDAARTSAAAFDSPANCVERDMPGNDVPLSALLNGAFRNLDRWSRDGIAPPHGKPLDVRDPGEKDASVAVDRFGNALGGVRMPQMDVPLARYYHRMTGPGICELWGYRRPFTADVVAKLYPARSAYIDKIRESVGRMVAEHWIEKADGDLIVDKAMKIRFP